MMSKLFTIEAKLDHIRPTIWRTFEFPGRYALRRLHSLLEILFGWKNSDHHEFDIYRILYTDPKAIDPEFGRGERDESAHLEDLVKRGTRFFYHYDFDDNWQVNLRVLAHRPWQAGDRPICLDGARAGPPQNCGGVSRYRELCEVLARPQHSQDSSRRRWAGGWDPEEFDLKDVNKRLARKFPPPKVRVPAPVPAARIGPYLVGKLNLRQQMAAALMEQDAPLSLDELSQRLQEAGTTLPDGILSLKRAWRRLPPMRETLDGRLELEPYHPAYQDLLSALQRHQPRCGDAAPTKATLPKPDLSRPITATLLREALAHGRPAKLSHRRLLLLILDSLGASAALERVLERLTLLVPYRLTVSDVLLSLRGQSCMRLRDGELSLQSEHDDLRKARLCLLQWWSPLEAAGQERRRWPERTERRKQEREQGYREVALRFVQAQKAILSHALDSDGLTVGLLGFPNHKRVVYSPGQRDDLKAALQRLDLVVGLDAKRIYERLGVSCEGKSFIDITPPGIHAGTPPSDPQLIAALQDTVPVPWPPGVSPDDLLARARVLHAFYTYGVRHGYVLRKKRQGFHESLVRWNLGLEIPLYSALKSCVELRCPLRISVNPRDALNPLEWETDFQPEELRRDGVRGRWLNSGREQVLELREIYSFSGDLQVPFTCFAFYQ